MSDSSGSGLRIGFVSTLDLTEVGGLETYVRSLTDALSGSVEQVTWNGQDPSGQYAFDPRWAKLNRQLLSLMTRPRLRWVSRKVAESIGEDRCRRWLGGRDVMHFVGTGWNLLGFAAVRSAARLGLARTCWPAIHPGQWGDSDLDFDLYAQMDAIFVQSDHEKRLFLERGIAEESLIRCDLAPSVPRTGNSETFVARHALQGRQLVLFLGRKCRLKGYHAVREAVRSMIEAGRPITLISIGSDVDGPYPALPHEADLDLGRVDDQIKSDALAACDVMALPSSVESFGLVYTEAWAYSKPVVCGDPPASQELIDRYGGGLASLNEPTDVADKLTRLLNDPSLRTDLGKAGYDAVCHQLSWKTVADRHRELWADLTMQAAGPIRGGARRAG